MQEKKEVWWPHHPCPELFVVVGPLGMALKLLQYLTTRRSQYHFFREDSHGYYVATVFQLSILVQKPTDPRRRATEDEEDEVDDEKSGKCGIDAYTQKISVI